MSERVAPSPRPSPPKGEREKKRELWRSRFITAASTVFGIALALMAADAANPPNLTRYNTLSPEVVDKDGKLLRPFLSKDGYWRLKTTPYDVNVRYLALLKAYEDQRFDSHSGVDPLAVTRAAFQFVTSGHIVSGASTLSMQAARLLEPRKRGIVTKIFQMVRAIQLEERYSKDEILSIYLTLAPFGGNLEGLRSASLAYFGKEPAALDLSESALLVSVPQSPERSRPDRHAIRAKAGRDHVLARVVDEGVVTASDAEVARREGVAFARLPMPLSAPHLAYKLSHDNKGGARIVTTLDAAMQSAVERLAVQERAYFDDGGALAIVVVENKTRNVVAYVGGTDYWGAAGQIDLATRARSPGSALKPFIYGLAFDDLVLHPSTMMTDEPTMFGDYAPKDFTGAFQGAVTARDALRMSLNIPAVMLLDRVGPLHFTRTLENAGATLVFPTREDAPSLPVALGGLGISLTDIAMLYAGIAEAGTVRPLRVLADAPDGKPHRLFGPVAAYYLRDILSGVSLPEGWAMGQGLSRKRNIAFKTGTSYGFRDAWSVGFSNDYTVAVWVGRADGAPRVGRVGREEAAPILLKTFGLLPNDKRPDPPIPQGTILARATDQLPPGLRIFTRDRAPIAPVATNIPPPTIAFPPNGSTVPLPTDKQDKAITLKADGGKGPLTWLVNGELLGSFDRFQPVQFAPDGEGFARITVVDARGLSDSSQVRFKQIH